MFARPTAIESQISVSAMSAIRSSMAACTAASRPAPAVPAEAAIIERMASMAERLIWLSIAVGLANIVLLAAAFVRRLHDSGHSALWAVVAGAAQLVSLALELGQVGNAEAMIRGAAAARTTQEALALQGGMAWQGLVGWIPLIILVVFGVMASDPGSNRYGEPPAQA